MVLGSTSVKHQSNPSLWSLIDVNPRVFAIWNGEYLFLTYPHKTQHIMLLLFSSICTIEKHYNTFHFRVKYPYGTNHSMLAIVWYGVPRMSVRCVALFFHRWCCIWCILLDGREPESYCIMQRKPWPYYLLCFFHVYISLWVDVAYPFIFYRGVLLSRRHGLNAWLSSCQWIDTEVYE